MKFIEWAIQTLAHTTGMSKSYFETVAKLAAEGKELPDPWAEVKSIHDVK